MKIYSKVFVILLTFFVAACAGVSGLNVPEDYQLSASSGNGLVLFSVSENCPSNMSIKVREVGKNSGILIAVDQSGAIRPTDIQWENPCGRLFVLEGHSGRFEIFSFVSFYNPSSSKNSNAYEPDPKYTLVKEVKNSYERPPLSDLYVVEPTSHFSISFEIVPGKVTYVGRIHFEHLHAMAITRVYLASEKDTDIALFRKMYPQFYDISL